MMLTRDASVVVGCDKRRPMLCNAAINRKYDNYRTEIHVPLYGHDTRDNRTRNASGTTSSLEREEYFWVIKELREYEISPSGYLLLQHTHFYV